GTDEEIDTITLHELLDLRQRHVGLGFGIFLQDLDRATAGARAALLEKELDPVRGVVALHGQRARVWEEQPDLHGGRLRDGGDAAHEDQQNAERGDAPNHRLSSGRTFSAKSRMFLHARSCGMLPKWSSAMKIPTPSSRVCALISRVT